jgi:hypothetical protein
MPRAGRIDGRRNRDVVEVCSIGDLPDTSRRHDIWLLLRDYSMACIMDSHGKSLSLAVRTVKREAHTRPAIMQDIPARL